MRKLFIVATCFGIMMLAGNAIGSQIRYGGRLGPYDLGSFDNYYIFWDRIEEDYYMEDCTFCDNREHYVYHNIIRYGYDPTRYTIVEGKIQLALYDDDESILDWEENLHLRFDDSKVYAFEVDTGTTIYPISTSDLKDGKINMYMGCADGDFYYDWSSLGALVQLKSPEPPPPVPVPSTLLLLGSGIVGMIGIRRKFRK